MRLTNSPFSCTISINMKNPEILDFKRNSNPFGPPKWLKRYLSESLNDAMDYPDYQNIEVNLAIAHFLNLNVENVSIANGSLEAIFLVPKIVDMSKTTIIEPTYWGYGVALDSYRMPYTKIVLKEKNNFEFDLDTLHRTEQLIYSTTTITQKSFILMLEDTKFVFSS